MTVPLTATAKQAAISRCQARLADAIRARSEAYTRLCQLQSHQRRIRYESACEGVELAQKKLADVTKLYGELS